jgi:hypothetical protein
MSFIGCSYRTFNTDIIGNWKASKDSKSIAEIRFYKDSFISNENGKVSKFKWKIRQSNLWYKLTSKNDTILKKTFEVDIWFSKNKDTLYFKNPDYSFTDKFIRSSVNRK